MTIPIPSGRFGAASVQSRDGTRIGYLSTGSGPGLLLIPGVLTVAADLSALAGELGRHFTVHVVDRRGRGGSGPQGPDYRIAAECEDLAAVQARTGATYLFGHSHGGLIALEFARGNRTLDGVVVYEPGVSVGRSVPVDWVPACSRELAADRPGDAFITFIRGVNPQSTGRVPRWLLKAIAARTVRDLPRKYRLLPTAIAEVVEAARLDDTYGAYREVAARTLVMVGARSTRRGPAAATAEALASVLPYGRLRTMSKMDHFGPEKHPRAVADAATGFLCDGGVLPDRHGDGSRPPAPATGS